jgi:two-component system, chemotaxis family, CheB/CheR fusion protein
VWRPLQGLIGNASDDRIDLTEIIRLELQAHGAGQGGQVTLAAPSLPLDGNRVQTFALVLHKLAVNAVKYGALQEQGNPSSAPLTPTKSSLPCSMRTKRLIS